MKRITANHTNCFQSLLSIESQSPMPMVNPIIKAILSLIIIFGTNPTQSLACTSAIIGAEATPDGRPLLWKLRDTNTTDNKVEYIASKDGEYSYVALFNASDRKCEQAWIGMNNVGFAVMNTASYNLKDDDVPQKKMDREGYLMTIALRSCRTVDDFQQLLETLPRPMGVEANFGAIDAEGNGAYFETNNHSFTRFDLKDAPGHVLIRTNYSHSGRDNEGYGFIREANAEYLLRPYIETQSVTAEVLTEIVSRSFWHNLKGRDYSESGEHWVIDQDFIPRYKSTATVVVEGIPPLEDASAITPGNLGAKYIMWTGIGYPPCSEILPVWCVDGGVPDCLRGISDNGHSSLGDEIKARRDDVFSIKKGNGHKYINMTKLYNEQGTGYVQRLRSLNHQTYEKTRRLRDAKPDRTHEQ